MVGIYLISQSVNNDYDTYDSAVVTAESEDHAKLIHPNGEDTYAGENSGYWGNRSWVDTPADVDAEYIGETPHLKPGLVLCASFFSA